MTKMRERCVLFVFLLKNWLVHSSERWPRVGCRRE